jgi:TolA-binding protein
MIRINKYLILLNILLFFTFLNAQSVADKFSDAMNAYNMERFADAQKLFDRLIEEYGVEDELYAAARYYSANSLLKMGKKDEAAVGFEFIINNIIWSNFREESLYNLGVIYFDAERYSVCREKLTKLLDEYPEGEYIGSSLYWIGESYSEENRMREAIDFLERAIEDKRSNRFRDYTIYTLANVYEKTEDYESAVNYYDQLLSYYPNSKLAVPAQIRIGVCYFHLNDYHSSILELNNPMLSNLPEDLYSEALYLLANSYYRVMDYDNAIKSYIEIIEKFPAAKLVRESKYGLAWAYFQKDNYTEAYNVFNFLSDGDDSIAVKSFIWKGEAKRYAGQQTDALKIYEEFLLRFPDSDLASFVEYQVGVIYFDWEKLNLSSRYLITATTSEDPLVRAKANTLLGEIELSNKKYLRAKKYFEPVLHLVDVNNEVYHRALLGLGAALFYLEEYDEAIDNLKKAEILNPSFENERLSFYLAENYFASGRFSEALIRYNAVPSSDPKLSKEALYGKAYCFFNMGDYESAAYQFSEFIERYPSDRRVKDVKLRMADSYFGSKNFVASSNVYRELYESGNYSLDDPYTYYQYAQALYKSGETREAINAFLTLQQRFPSSKYADNSLYTVGWINFQEGNYKEAIEDYQNVLKVYKNSSLAPIVYYSIGDAYFNLGKYDPAIENYQKVLSNYPASQYVYDAVNGIQYCYVVKGEPERAVQLIDGFTEANPNQKFSDQIYFKKGELYYSQRNYEKAKISYQEFIVKYPNSGYVAEAYYWIGKSAENLEQKEEAIFHFNKVFEKYPNSESAAASVLEIGKIQNSLENFQAAIQIYEAAGKQLKDSPRMPEILFMKGTTFIKLNDMQKAYDTFNELVFYHRDTFFADQARFEMGLIDLAAERYENADGLFLEIAGKRTDDLGAKAQYYYGFSLYEQEKTTEAISALVRIRTVYSTFDEWLARSYILLGDCYVKLDDKRKAEEMYRAVLSKHRGDTFGEEAREKLRKLL